MTTFEWWTAPLGMVLFGLWTAPWRLGVFGLRFPMLELERSLQEMDRRRAATGSAAAELVAKLSATRSDGRNISSNAET